MMKITQLLTNLKLWQGIFVSFLLLISLNLSAQNVGDDLLANSNGQVDTSSGWGGSGAGCFSWGGGTYDGVTQCGWTSGAGLNYAPTTGGHGPTHSGDRMFKSYKTNGTNGEFIAQEVGELALGTYTYSFFHRWTGGTVDYTEGAPKFTIKKANADGGWDNVLVVDLAVGETGAAGAWTETTGTWENTEGGQYKIQVYKNGVANPGLAQNLHLDTFSFVYTAEAAVTEPAALEFKGILDFTVNHGAGFGANDGKAVHLLATGDIADLSTYSIALYANGNTSVYNDFTLPAISASTGDEILIARTPEALEAYMSASTYYTTIIDAGTWPTSNGNDAMELVRGYDPDTELYTELVDTFGVVGDNPDTQGGGCTTDDCWDHEDAWAYKADGVWTYGPVNSTDGDSGGSSTNMVTICDSEFPYPFVVCEVAATGCDGSINMYDSYGDGWNGGTLDVYVNDVLAGTFANTSDAAANEAQSIPVSTSFGDVVTFDFTCGSYCYETSFTVTDADGNVVASGGGASDADATFECLDPNAINFAVSATTDGGSATFTFDIANFTVGAAAGEGDGHIHYSLNGGEEVMVYSTDPLTLSDLPNGDHNIVFSLVDASHQPLDPAVEATVEFSTFDGTVGCGESISTCYDSTGSSELWFTTTAPEGQLASVTFAGGVENNYDFVIVTNGAGVDIGGSLTGDLNGVTVTSDDNGLMVYIDSDGSWSCQSGQSGFDSLDATVSCATPQTAVTFSVNTENIEVGPNGMYVGGGVLGDAMAYMMADDDADGVYEVTVNLDQGLTGNYIFLNSPDDGGDWDAKEILDGQECADPNNWNDRILDPVGEEDYTLLHCFGECSGNGTGECPAAVDTYEVTFSVDTSNYPGGLGESDAVYLNGNFNGWCGECNPMSDDDGDGIWTVTISLEDGDYEYKFTVNGWSSQEEFGAIGAVEGCTVSDGTYTNRSLTVAGEDMVLPTVYWNLCPGESPGEVYNITFNLDATGIEVGANGMYMGGGILAGGATAVAMSDDDGDGIWTVTIEISTDQIGGNYTFLNSPNDSGDWDAKEDISGQECADPDNYNDRIVPEFSGDAEFCYVFAVCTDGVCPAEVCIPVPMDCSFGDGFVGLVMADIDNSDSGCSPDGYGDFTELSTELAQGQTVPVTITTGYSDQYIKAWVDFNDDLVFGPDEVVIDNVLIAATGTTDIDVVIPAEAALGAHVMRFKAHWGFEVPDDPCAPTAYGEAEDYTVVIVEAGLSIDEVDSLDMRIYPNPVDGNYVTIQSPIQGLIEVEVYTVTGRKLLQTVLTDDKLDVSSFNSGFYMVKVTINGQSKLSKLVVR